MVSVIIFIFLINLVFCESYQSIDLKISSGIIRGLRIRTAQNKEAFAFLGIPYATPPYNHLRFKVPIAHSGWDHVLDATNFQSMCPQHDSRGNLIGDENCLFLNVYAPSIRNRNPSTDFSSTTHFPVMVYIQGESFENGDSAMYGAELLLDRDVVVVTFNYRIGVLGFLSTEDETASGNWGLFDQKLALEWIRKNIAAFNGNPNLVTIFGQGSGAASVIYHVISPLSQGLFSRAIAQSGSALCDWALERSPLSFAREVAQSVGCPTQTNIDLVNCLRKTPFFLLLRAQSKGKIFGEFPQRSAPVIERSGTNRFIPNEPRVLISSGNFPKIPLMIGINSDETSYFYPVNNKLLRRDPKALERKVLPQFLEATTRFKGPQKKEIIQSILYKYFNGLNLANISDIGHRFINMSSDAIYTSCIDETLKLYSENKGGPAFMYLFGYRGAQSLVNLLIESSQKSFETGVCHGDELFYLFDLKMSSLSPPNNKDKQIRERVLTLWTDFAKYGVSPHFVNYEFPRWHPFDEYSLNYYRIDSDLLPERAYRQPEAHFWSKYLPNLYGDLPVVQPLSKVSRPYATLAWTMIGISLTLFVLIVILLATLYYQRKRQIFRTQPPEGSAISSTGSSFLY